MEQTGTTLMISHFFSSLLYSYFVSVVKEMTQQTLNTSSALEKYIKIDKPVLVTFPHQTFARHLH
jgi:hypothetical protein